MIKKIILMIVVVIMLSSRVFACIDAGASFAAEVLVVLSGVSYDLEKLEKIIDANHKKIHFGKETGLAYISHYDKRVVVIVTEDVYSVYHSSYFDLEKIYGISMDDIKKYEGKKYFNIIIQIPYKKNEENNGFQYVEAVDLKGEGFDFSAAMKTELLWLRKEGIIRGLTDQDIEKISEKSQRSKAGEGNRILYSDVTLKEGGYSSVGGARGCGSGFSPEIFINLVK